MIAAGVEPARGFPWEDAMKLGFGALRLSSDAFWRLTPRELAAAMRAFHGGDAPPLDHNELRALIARFPD